MVTDVIDRLKSAGLTVTLLPPDRLEVSPKNRITDELRVMIRANKPALMIWLQGTTLPTAHRLDVSPRLRSASAALDAQVLASGGSLEVPPEKPAEVSPNLDTPSTTKRWSGKSPPHVLSLPHVFSDWLPLATAYHDHHWKCRTCQAASQGRGLRCGAGMALWVNYQDQF